MKRPPSHTGSERAANTGGTSVSSDSWENLPSRSGPQTPLAALQKSSGQSQQKPQTHKDSLDNALDDLLGGEEEEVSAGVRQLSFL